MVAQPKPAPVPVARAEAGAAAAALGARQQRQGREAGRQRRGALGALGALGLHRWGAGAAAGGRRGLPQLPQLPAMGQHQPAVVAGGGAGTPVWGRPSLPEGAHAPAYGNRAGSRAGMRALAAAAAPLDWSQPTNSGGASEAVTAAAPLKLIRQLGIHGAHNRLHTTLLRRCVPHTDGRCVAGEGFRGGERNPEDDLAKVDVLDLTQHASHPSQLYAAYGNGRVVGWDAEYGRIRANFSPRRRRSGVRCVDCDGDLVYCGFSDGYMRIYDQRSWTCVKAERVHGEHCPQPWG